MSNQRTGHGLLVALSGAAGVFVVGFFGAEVMFAPGSDGVPLEATLVPSGLAAFGMFAHLLSASGPKPA